MSWSHDNKQTFFKDSLSRERMARKWYLVRKMLLIVNFNPMCLFFCSDHVTIYILTMQY